ncbi:MAG TPA: hypothetical protein VMU27_00110, partial [Candidatus Paceibacterota bacterium]|nr:hypothetical protein [Candidatus Paceibacterota bacterium]
MNNEPPNTTKTSLKQGVMEAIQKGRIRMRPRWHFVLFSSLATLGVLIMFLAVLYIASLSIFFLHDSGAWFAPRFGGRGWWSLLQSLPWLLITLLIVFICVLQIAVRRYEFVYRRPLLISAAAILAIVFIGGFAIAETPLHRQMEFYAHHNELPPPLSLAYGAPLHMPAPPGIFH